MGFHSAVYINGRLSRWFLILQGVKQGSVLSMLLYICFLNPLLIEIINSGYGACIFNLHVGSPGYADDLATITLSQTFMQNIINIVYNYSIKWKFDLSNKKCATMTCGVNTPSCSFFIGDFKIKSVTSYKHVGVVMYSKGGNTEYAEERIASSKRSFYSMVGCSTSTTSLSPMSMSKLYWTVCVAMYLYGAEVRCFSKKEIQLFSNFHKCMCRDIQCLPENTPEDAILGSLGWRSIYCHIDVVKVIFAVRILLLDVNSIYRIVFIRRFLFILHRGLGNGNSGPTYQIILSLLRFNLLDTVLNFIESCIIPPKTTWKRIVNQYSTNLSFSRWRFSLALFSKLSLYRTVHTEYKPVCWWMLSKGFPHLRTSCTVMVRLLCGSHSLAVCKQSHLNRNDRKCQLCDDGVVEDLFHFIMVCPKWALIRQSMLNNISNNLSEDSSVSWHSLTNNMQFLILIGLEFPLPPNDITCVRKQACISISNMYKKRREFEPP